MNKIFKYVAVQLSEEEDFMRAIVIKLENENIFEVFLLDYGKNIKLEKSKIFVCHDSSFIENIVPLSFTCTLYGLFPIEDCLFGKKK